MSLSEINSKSIIDLHCGNCYKDWRITTTKLKQSFVECSNCHNKIVVNSTKKFTSSFKSKRNATKKTSTMRHVGIKYDKNMIKTQQSDSTSSISQATISSSTQSSSISSSCLTETDEKTLKLFQLAQKLARRMNM